MTDKNWALFWTDQVITALEEWQFANEVPIGSTEYRREAKAKLRASLLALATQRQHGSSPLE